MARKRKKKDIDTLKSQWEKDPNWDIEETKGFEAHKDELRLFRLEKQAESERLRSEKIKAFAKEHGVENFKLANLIFGITELLYQIESKIEDL